MKYAKRLQKGCRLAVVGGAYETSHHVRREHPRPEGGRMTHWDDDWFDVPFDDDLDDDEYYDDFVDVNKMVNKEDV